MTKIYDIRSEHYVKEQGTHPALTALDYPKVPVGALFVSHNKFRDTSRWTHVERKRPFEVAKKGKPGMGWVTIGWYKTLEHAVKAAEDFLKV